VYLDSAVFALVILILLVRPGGLFILRGQRSVERV
jgi:branched-subunit amino acid ABC-type transport system permease component